ncbi:RNA recognition motif, partial [Trifolium medium]|nr:RNA recognition motif [Trifolium medium]
MLENVSVARKRNIRGNRYVFVRFSNVRDVTKLLHAINDISFDQVRIWAKVARFDRSYEKGKDKARGRRDEGMQGGLKEGMREKKGM